VALMLSHFRCELAARRLAAGAADEARALLQTALRRDPGCVRASLMLGDVECAGGRHREAIAALRQAARQDPDHLSETIATMRHCCAALGEEEAMRQWLQTALEQSPTAAVVMAVAEDLSDAEGVDAACEFLSARLEEQPSLRGLEQLITLQLGASDGRARDALGLLQVLVRRLLADRPAYRCGHCGFAGRQLHWACPGCSRWGSMKSIRGAPGE
jgi:lipopolysaccharide biosynthesis regulator YciM